MRHQLKVAQRGLGPHRQGFQRGPVRRHHLTSASPQVGQVRYNLTSHFHTLPTLADKNTEIKCPISITTSKKSPRKTDNLVPCNEVWLYSATVSPTSPFSVAAIWGFAFGSKVVVVCVVWRSYISAPVGNLQTSKASQWCKNGCRETWSLHFLGTLHQFWQSEFLNLAAAIASGSLFQHRNLQLVAPSQRLIPKCHVMSTLYPFLLHDSKKDLKYNSSHMPQQFQVQTSLLSSWRVNTWGSLVTASMLLSLWQWAREIVCSFSDIKWKFIRPYWPYGTSLDHQLRSTTFEIVYQIFLKMWDLYNTQICHHPSRVLPGNLLLDKMIWRSLKIWSIVIVVHDMAAFKTHGFPAACSSPTCSQDPSVPGCFLWRPRFWGNPPALLAQSSLVKAKPPPTSFLPTWHWKPSTVNPKFGFPRPPVRSATSFGSGSWSVQPQFSISPPRLAAVIVKGRPAHEWVA